MSDAEQPETTLVVKRSAAALLRDATAPKVELRGRVARHVEVESLSLGGGLVVSGKLLLEHGQEDDRAAVRSLLDGSGADVTVKFLPNSKGKVWTTDGFYSGGFREDGLTGKECVLIEGDRAYAGQALSGMGCGRGRIHKSGGDVFSGAVCDTKASGRGTLLAGNYALRGVFKDDKPDGRFHVSHLEDGSSYAALYVDGTEQLSRRGKRKASTALADYDEAAEDDEREETADEIDKRIAELKAKLKAKRKAEATNGATNGTATAEAAA